MRPTCRLLADLKTHGLDMAQGTLTDGLKSIAPLFVPLYNDIIAKNLEEDRWHADETRWLVFAAVEGKVGYKWYMWVFLSPSAVVYTLDQSRSSKVPKAHFGTLTEGILVVDRYSAYKAFVKGINIILAFCWAHVRRDFLGLAKDWPQHETWAIKWVDDIANLYHLNNLRVQALEQPQAFAQKDRNLRDAVEKMAQKRDSQLKEKSIGSACTKVLLSLKNHWEGLTVFLDHPEVPMDNNKAERMERIPVLGRKNFYGSGAIWSGQLSAILFSIFQTLILWNINPRSWLTAFLEACALNQGKAPDDILHFLPWNMSQEQQKTFSLEPQIKDSS
jgi:transposase